MKLPRRALLRVALLAVTAPRLALAQSQPSLPVSEASAVRAVVRAQLDAFAADDAVRAFSYAADGIRDRFGSAGQFMQMVRGSYPMVVRPAAVTFLAPRRADAQVLQPVQLTDREGRMWLALYSLQPQPDGGWRISGCQVIANDGRST
jgi:hypothetical protein